MSPLILPRICLVCQIYHQDTGAICWHCQSLIPRLTTSCQGCGKIGWTNCPTCRKHGSIFRYFFAVYPYCEPIKTLIQSFKVEPAQDILHLFANDLLKILPENLLTTQCLIPVPLHPKRLSQRGFHHTALIARHLSQRLTIPWSLRYCEKIKQTPNQAELNQTERQHNLIDAFRCYPLRYQHITLIDDVATTGQTLKQLALGFLAQGVSKIDVWVIAKA